MVYITKMSLFLQVNKQHFIILTASPRVANTASAVAAASSNLRTFGTKSGTPPKSAARIAQDLMKTKGISGLYKGLGATLARYLIHLHIIAVQPFNLIYIILIFSVTFLFSGTCHFPVFTFPCLPFCGLRLVTCYMSI